jgi:hypothetical protein
MILTGVSSRTTELTLPRLQKLSTTQCRKFGNKEGRMETLQFHGFHLLKWAFEIDTPPITLLFPATLYILLLMKFDSIGSGVEFGNECIPDSVLFTMTLEEDNKRD